MLTISAAQMLPRCSINAATKIESQVSNSRHFFVALALCALPACHVIDRQFQSANYGRFGSAVFTECRFSGSTRPDRCANVALCVNLYMRDHDPSTPAPDFPAYEMFTDALVEFIYNKPSVFDAAGQPLKPNRHESVIPGYLEYRLRDDGTILRWSAEAEDWLPTNRNIRSESLPRRMGQLLEAAKSSGDAAALHLFQLFLEARADCFGQQGVLLDLAPSAAP